MKHRQCQQIGKLGYDPEKNARNVRGLGLPCDDVILLDWSTAIERQDTRKYFGEIRFQAFVNGPDSTPYDTESRRDGNKA